MELVYGAFELTGTHDLPSASGHSFIVCMKVVKCSHELIWFLGAIIFELAIVWRGTLLMKHYRAAVTRGAIRKWVRWHVNYLVFIATIHEIRGFDFLPFEYWSLQIRKLVHAGWSRMKGPVQVHMRRDCSRSLNLHQLWWLVVGLYWFIWCVSLNYLFIVVKNTVVVGCSAFFRLLIHDWFLVTFIVVVPFTLLLVLLSIAHSRAFCINKAIRLFHHLTLRRLYLLLERFLHLWRSEIWICPSITYIHTGWVLERCKPQTRWIWIGFYELTFTKARRQIILMHGLIFLQCDGFSRNHIRLILLRWETLLVIDFFIRFHLKIVVKTTLLEKWLFISHRTEVAALSWFLIYFKAFVMHL